jgi:hypothetical protein
MSGRQGKVDVAAPYAEGASASPFQEQFNSIFGVSALNFVVLGGAEILMLLLFADLMVFLFSRNHSVADLPFQLQTIGLGGVFVFALHMVSAKLPDLGRIIFGNRQLPPKHNL